MRLRSIAAIGLLLVSAIATTGQTTAFNYQGNLTFSGQPANGSFDFEFALFNAAAAGSQLGTTQAVNNVAVANGNFTVNLDFGSQFPGANRFLEIRVRQAGQPGFTTLSPRQTINSTPYSVKSVSADTANNASNATTANNALNLGGVAANQYVLTGDARLSDARTPTAGSANYIQNSASQQASSNFNISGTGTANIFNAATQFNLGGQRILSATGENTFAGFSAGAANTFTSTRNTFFGSFAGSANVAGSNSFFGANSGRSNTQGDINSFFGADSGQANTTGLENSFFGASAGSSNTTGNLNSFFGSQAGNANTAATGNSFFGARAGRANTNGFSNSFFGGEAGFQNTTGQRNSFFGAGAGLFNTTGNSNTFVGDSAAQSNTTGSNNTLLGAFTVLQVDNLNYATAIGANARVNSSDTVVIGKEEGTYGGIPRSADAVRIPGNLNVGGTITGNIDGSGLNNINASNITVGTINDARLSSNVATLAGAQVFTGPKSFVGGISGNGSGLGNLDASSIATGTLSNARLGVIGISNGGTGSATQNFVDLTTNQTNIGGNKTFTGILSGNSVSSATNYTLGGNPILGAPQGTNLFAGFGAGAANTTGGSNSFFGTNTGESNTSGRDNSFFGRSAGSQNTEGRENTFLGRLAGSGSIANPNPIVANTTGSNNTFVGADAAPGAPNLNFATAIGSFAFVNSSDTVVIGKSAGIYNGVGRPADTVQVPGNLNVAGSLTGNIDGTGVTNVNASNITTGTLADARLSANVATLTGAQTFTGPKTFAGGISGSGANLTDLNASNLSSGTLPDVRLSTNVATLSGAQTFTGPKTFAGGLNGSGANLTSLNASNVSSGTLADARLSTNVATLSGAQTFTGAKTFAGGLSGSGANLTDLNAANITTGTLSNARLGVIGIANGGTGSTTQNFVDLSTDQASIGGNKTFTGTVSANVVNAATQFNIGGSQVLATPADNTFVGGGAGTSTTTGFGNTFVGLEAGKFTTTGNSNSFFGSLTGRSNTEGFSNSFFGTGAGRFNTIGNTNSFFGSAAGFANTTGASNSFFGRRAGANVSTASFNSFFGTNAGELNTTGTFNAFFGADAGNANTTGSGNSFFGASANALSPGLSNATAIGSLAAVSQSNSLVLGSINGINGAGANTNVGIGTTAPSERLHVVGNGLVTGNLTVTGTITGNLPAGSANYIQNGTTQQASSNFNISGTGTANVFDAVTEFRLGTTRFVSGNGIATNLSFPLGGQRTNTLIGEGAGTSLAPVPNNVGFFGMHNTFIGLNAGSATTNGRTNTFVGAAAGAANVSGDANTFVGTEAGRSNTGSGNSFVGQSAGSSNTTGASNTFVGNLAGRLNQTGSRNTVLGIGTLALPALGDDNTFIGSNPDYFTSNRTTTLGARIQVTATDNATAIGFRASVTQNNSLVLGSINGINGANADTNVGIGTTAPTSRLQIVDSDNITTPDIAQFFAQNLTQGVGIGFNRIEAVGTNANQDLFIVPKGAGEVQVSGLLRVTTLGAAGSTQLCRNASNQIATCSSSIRYKQNIAPFAPGLSFIRKLRPIAYEWKADGMKDVGFGAEDVAKIDPRFVTFNDKGEVEGIKYDRMSAAFVNAFREQQIQIEAQQKEAGELKETVRRQAEALKSQKAEIDALKQLVCAQNQTAPVCKAKN